MNNNKYKYYKYKKKYIKLKQYYKKLDKQNGGFFNKKKNYTYYFGEDVTNDQIIEVNKYLLDELGWKSKGYTFNQVDNIKDADIQVHFKDNYGIAKIIGGNKELSNLSVTDYGTNPTSIHFNINNWINPPKPFVSKNDRLQKYRGYLVQHEFGHAIGYGHDTRPNKPNNSNDIINCPVMLQQTRFTEPYCKANPWVSKELEK